MKVSLELEASKQALFRAPQSSLYKLQFEIFLQNPILPTQNCVNKSFTFARFSTLNYTHIHTKLIQPTGYFSLLCVLHVCYFGCILKVLKTSCKAPVSLKSMKKIFLINRIRIIPSIFIMLMYN